MNKHFAHFLMLISAFIWGTTFVAQTTGMETIGPMTFTSIRYLIGTLTVLPFALFEMKKKNISLFIIKNQKLSFMIIGLGILMFGGISLQQIALQNTKVANAAFLTALYVPLVPVILWFLKNEKIKSNIWIAILFSIYGSWLLSGSSDYETKIADLLVIIGSFFWAGHIILIGIVIRKFNAPFQYAMYQSLICFLLSAIPMFIFENPKIINLIPVLPELLYAGVFSVGIAYTLQIVAQVKANTTVAAFILSLESVFAALSGWILIGQNLTFYSILGCSLIFLSVLIADIVKINFLK